MKYLGGVFVGNSTSYEYAGSNLFVKLVYLWLRHIVGWAFVDSDGSAVWDSTAVAGASDGVTDVSDPEIFTSATGGFSALTSPSTNIYLLMVKGFADGTKDGFYRVYEVLSNTQVRIKKEFCGHHTDGFQLNQTGLTWAVYNFSTAIDLTSKWVVLAGTGVGGTFHVKFWCDTSNNEIRFQTSPYDDWDASANAWKTPARYISEVSGSVIYPNFQIGFGCADLSHAVIVFKHWSHTMGLADAMRLIYIGDITPFRPAVDTNPVIRVHMWCPTVQNDYGWQFFPNWFETANDGSIAMLTKHNTQAAGARILHASKFAGTYDAVLGYNKQQLYSYHSGKMLRIPYLVVNYDETYNEIRGYLKSIEETYQYSIIPALTPFGSSLDKLRGGNFCIPWHGSKQYRKMM